MVETSIRCLATIFGLNYDGSIDQSDNGQGAFIDPSTRKPYNTRDHSLVGCSIPIPILWATIGERDYAGISEKKYVVDVKSLVTGKACSNVPIVDLGPGEHGHLLHNRYFDCTYGLAHALGHTDNGDVEYQIVGPNGELEIKGLS